MNLIVNPTKKALVIFSLQYIIKFILPINLTDIMLDQNLK